MTYKLHDLVLAKISSSFICKIDGNEVVYKNGEELLGKSFDKDYVVSDISSREGMVVVTLVENDIIPNDLNADWAKEHMDRTGKEISFF